MEFMFLYVFVFCISRVSYVDVCVIFLVKCILSLVVSREEGISLLPKCGVVVFVFLRQCRNVLVNAADITQGVIIVQKWVVWRNKGSVSSSVWGKVIGKCQL